MKLITGRCVTLQKKQRGGEWSSYRPHCGARGYKVKLNGVLIVHHILKNNADFIATFNLKVALVLPGELEAKDKRIAELTDALTQMIGAHKITARFDYERITECGADCDSPEKMTSEDPIIRMAEACLHLKYIMRATERAVMSCRMKQLIFL